MALEETKKQEKLKHIRQKKTRKTASSKDKCTLNTIPRESDNITETIDEYNVIDFEDEFDKDTLPMEELEDVEEIINHITQAFGSTYDTTMQEEVQQISAQQGLSPRG